MATTSSTSSALALSGLASGMDWTSIVQELLTVEAAPETQMKAQLSTDQQKNTAYQTIGTDLTALQKDVNTLSDASFFDSRTTSVANPSIASATASAATPLGAYTFTVGQMASDASQLGSPASGGLSPTDDVSSLVLSSAGFATPVTAGTFSVNGQTVTIATSDTLQSVFDKINTATGGAVTGSYDSTTDEITLANTDPANTTPIVLGSATDTSNFLQAAELYNNGTATVASATAVGGVSLTNTLNNANLSAKITPTAGTFTVDGQTVTIASGDTWQNVFDNINTATGGDVTGSYDPSADKITLSSNDPITLGSATDTSNFLEAAELYTNGAGTVNSSAALGGINLNNTVTTTSLNTTVTDGGSGEGQFLINGVAINFNASTDTVNSVLQRINDSAAGVTATYDSVDGRLELTNKTTGDVGISLKDVTGNFLAASGLSSGTLQRGNNLQYSINGGGTLTSQSNTVDAGAAGVTGLSVTAAGKGSTTISVNTDTSTISSAINSFVTDYNAVQNYISSQTTPTTSSTGTVTPGLLTGNLDVENIMVSLRQLVDASPGSTPGVESLNDLGVLSNGNDNTLSASNTAALTSALTTNLSAVKDLFTNSTTGIAITLGKFVNTTSSLTGVLNTDEGNMTNEATTITNSINTLQTKISNDQTRLDNEFTAMETAINSINSEKQYLNDYFNSSSASSQSAPVAAGSGSSSSSSSSA